MGKRKDREERDMRESKGFWLFKEYENEKLRKLDTVVSENHKAAESDVSV